MNVLDLAPWQQLPYFSTFTETLFPPGPATQILTRNNQRLGMIVSAFGGGTGVVISTSQALSVAGSGISITPTLGNVFLSSAIHGLLPTLDWWATGSSSYTVIEILLLDWPKDGDDMLKNIRHPLYVPPPPQIITAPGVKGDQGIMSYWRSIVDRIKGRPNPNG